MNDSGFSIRKSSIFPVLKKKKPINLKPGLGIKLVQSEAKHSPTRKLDVKPEIKPSEKLIPQSIESGPTIKKISYDFSKYLERPKFENIKHGETQVSHEYNNRYVTNIIFTY